MPIVFELARGHENDCTKITKNMNFMIFPSQIDRIRTLLHCQVVLQKIAKFVGGDLPIYLSSLQCVFSNMFPQISNWVKIFTNFKHRVFCVVTSCKIRRRRLANFTSNLFPAHFSDFIWRRRRTKHLDMSVFCVSMRMILKYLIKLVTYFGICMWLLTSQVWVEGAC